MLKGCDLLDSHLAARRTMHRRADDTIGTLANYIQHLVLSAWRIVTIRANEAATGTRWRDGPTLNLTFLGAAAAEVELLEDLVEAAAGCSGISERDGEEERKKRCEEKDDQSSFRRKTRNRIVIRAR